MAGQSRKLHPGFLRNAKVIGAITVVAIACVVAAFMSMKHRSDSASEVNIPPVTTQGGKPSPETPHYTQTLNKANQEDLAKAQQTGATFIPAFSDRNAQIDQQLAQRNDATPVERIDYQHPNAAPQGQPGQPGQPQQLPPLPSPTQGVGNQVQNLVGQWDNPPQSQEVLGLQKDAQAAATAAASMAAATGVATAAQSPKTPTISASDRYYAHLENGIDTDADSDVLAVLDQGPCKGAQLMGTGKLTGEEVTASFSTMRCNGKTVAITAVALNDQTLSNALPADMDHHVISHIAVPALLGAIGAAGAVFSNAGASVTQNALGGTTVVQNPRPSASQLQGAAVSGGVNGMQGVIQKEVAAVPALTGRVAMNTPFIVLFKSDVITQ